MKTVFKKGMKVYDQLNFPNKEGVVVEVNNDESDEYPIGVSFENEEGRYYYTPEGCFYKEQISTLSTKPYKVEFQGFEQKAFVPTYEEVIKEARSKGDYYYLPDSLEAPSKELVEATIALLKLLFLRDYYNEGWQPDWRNYNEIKWTIENVNNNLTVTNEYTFNQVMFFNSEKLAFKFLEEQKELLEIAKPLL